MRCSSLKDTGLLTPLLCLVVVCLTVPPVKAQYSGGTGTPEDPYQIATANDLIALGETPDDYDKHFIMTADIDLDPNLPGGRVFDRAVIAADTNSADDYYPEFQGIPFKGNFEGNAHVIKYLTIEGESFLGIFGQIASGAEVKGLGVVDATIIASGWYIGGLIGSNYNWLSQDAGKVTEC